MAGQRPPQETDPGGERVSMEVRDGVLVVRGEIDAASAASVARTVRAPGPSADGYRIDLTGVRYIDSRGIEALFELAADGLEITVADGSLLQRVLHTVAMDQVAKVRTQS